jgi:hypothetical protein
MKRILIFFCIVSGCKKDSSTSTPTPDQDPIAYYTFSGNANDQSRYANHSTAVNAVMAPDSFRNENSAYYFNQSYIEIQDNDILDIGTKQLTISAWIFSNDVSGSYIVQKATYVNNGQITEGGGPYSLDIFPGTARAVLHDIDNYSHTLTGTTPVQNYVWQHIAVTWDGYTASLYYNGQVEATESISKPLLVTNGNVYIGAYKFVFPAACFHGAIDNVRIYNRCLSTAEIQELYSNYK